VLWKLSGGEAEQAGNIVKLTGIFVEGAFGPWKSSGRQTKQNRGEFRLGAFCLGAHPPCCEGEYPEQCLSDAVVIALDSGLKFDERAGELENKPHGRE
jgi:hypothetical protein